MREPWLFWSGLALASFAGVCLLLASHTASQRTSRVLEIMTGAIAGTAALLMGVEIAFRTAAKDTLGLQTDTAIGLVLLTGGLMWLINAVLKAFDK